MSLHRIGLARESLYGALAPVLDPGRVSPYPAPRDVGIRVWIDVPSVAVNGRTIEVDFPVHCTYDGAERAQVAGLDDVVSRVWDACERAELTTVVRVSPGPDVNVAGETRRRQVLTARVSIGARTLCLPDDPGSSPIPPDQAQE